MNEEPDATDRRGEKLRRAVELNTVERGDRWPARGKTGTASGDYQPLDDVSRDGKRVPYRRYPD